MGTIFKSTLRVLVREKGLFVWALAFPIILSTMFMFMFANLDEAVSFEPVTVGVADDNAWDESPFSQVVEGLAESGDDQLLELRAFPDEAAVREALLAGEIAGAYRLSDDGEPIAMVAPSTGAADFSALANVNRTIVETIATTYVRDADLLARIAEENPMALADPTAVEAALSGGNVTEEVSLTRTAPRETVRFYYALFGMAALFGAQITVFAICQTQPNLTPVGARRALGAVSRTRTLVATVAASWLVAFACLAAAFLYVRFVVGVEFGGREGWCVLGLGAATLLACGLGCALGAVPKIDFGAKAGILTGVTCLLSLFAGLYGEPCMQLADLVAQKAPLLATLNPAKAICDMFYSLYYYDGLDVFAVKVAGLAVMAVVLFALSALLMRRQRYESL